MLIKQLDTGRYQKYICYLWGGQCRVDRDGWCTADTNAKPASNRKRLDYSPPIMAPHLSNRYNRHHRIITMALHPTDRTRGVTKTHKWTHRKWHKLHVWSCKWRGSCDTEISVHDNPDVVHTENVHETVNVKLQFRQISREERRPIVRKC